MVGVLDTSLDYVTRLVILPGWTEANEHDPLKYQVIKIGLAWESNNKTVYTKLKACFLDGKS